MRVPLLPSSDLHFEIIEDVNVSAAYPLDEPGVTDSGLQIGEGLPEEVAAVLVEPDYLEEDLVISDGVDGGNGLVDFAVLDEVDTVQEERVTLHDGSNAIQ